MVSLSVLITVALSHGKAAVQLGCCVCLNPNKKHVAFSNWVRQGKISMEIINESKNKVRKTQMS